MSAHAGRRIRAAREAVGLTQNDAARRAGVGLATWRRWEDDPASVRAETAAKCERVLLRRAQRHPSEALAERLREAWPDGGRLTLRQADAFVSVLRGWVDLDIEPWLEGGHSEPGAALHKVTPFDRLDLRVMVLVNENRPWAALAAQRCHTVAGEIARGVLPVDRDGCFFDELVLHLAVGPAREAAKSDDTWDAVEDAIHDAARWADAHIPTVCDHALLSTLLAQRHPFTWFDPPVVWTRKGNPA